MFYDTWLDGEEQIWGQYIDEWMALGREIYDIIQEKFARELVAYEYIEDNIRLSVIRHRARLIFVKYHDNDHVREIYDIQIFHK